MPHTLGEIFAHAQLLNFKNRNSWAGPGAASVLVDQHVRMQRAETQSQQSALLQTAAETTAGGSTHWQLAKKTWKLIVEFVTAKRLVCKNGHSLVEPPSRVFYTVSVSACLFVGEQLDSFKKFTGARSRRPHHSHFSHGRQHRRSSFCRCRTVREEVRIWWQSRGL